MFKKIALVGSGILVLVGIAFVGQALLGNERVSVVNTENEFEDTKENLSILILGQVGPGQGGRWHSAPNLTDAIVLLHYRPSSNIANLVSLPRDLYGQFGGSYSRLNTLYEEDRQEDLLGGVTSITGIEVDKHIVIDLGIVSKAIDGLGGVDIDLPTKVVDPVSGFTLEAGPQRLTGEDAVWLMRNRFAPEGDFFREKNQHLVIEAVFNKFSELSTWRKTAVLFSLLPLINKSPANFSAGDVFYQFNDLVNLRFNSIVLDFSTELLVSDSIPTDSGERASVLIPSEGLNQYTKIKEFISGKIL